MLSRTLLFALLIFLPGLVVAATAVWFGVRGTLKLGLLTLAGLAVPGYVLFWVYLASSKTGFAVSEFLLFALVGLLTFFLIRFTARQRRRMFPLLIPAGLTFFAALGVLSLGFLYGGKATPLETAKNRFSHPLPSDNEIPLLFAEGLQKSAVPRPLLGDWQSSDRPPLQTGLILALASVMRPEPLDYEIVSVILQCLWVFAVWLLLRAFRLSLLTSGLAIMTICLSGFALVNSFYVWPKLLAATYTLAFATPLLALRPTGGRAKWWQLVLFAFLITCGLLAHGGSLFALIGILLFALLTGLRGNAMRQSLVVCLLALVLYAPWAGYQKFIDPPGDRLLKMHLAGIGPATSVPALEAILGAYKKQTFSYWEFGKKMSMSTVFGHEGEFFRALGLDAAARKELRVQQFFFLMPSIGFAGSGILGVLWWRKSKELRAARRLLACFLLTAIPTILLMFQPMGTVVHQTSYAMVLMAMAGSILALRAALPRVAIVVCASQCVWSWMLYEPDLRTLTVPGFQAVGMNGGMMGLHVFALVGMLVFSFGGIVWDWVQVGQLQLMASKPFRNC